MNSINSRATTQGLLDKFSPEFREKILSDPLAQQIFRSLNHGTSHFAIIEQLLDIIKNQDDRLRDFYLNKPMEPIIIPINECNEQIINDWIEKYREDITRNNNYIKKDKNFFDKLKNFF